MKPTIGRTVIYKANEVDLRRMTTVNCNRQKELPATIVAVWGDDEGAAVNLKVHLDGEGDLWKTSVYNGPNPGEWHWPKRV